MSVATRFAALGALLFVAVHAWRAAPAAWPAASAQRFGDATDEELLYRAALARGLAGGDGLVQRRLAQLGALLQPDGDGVARANAARAAGLERSDPVVRRRLVARMRAAIEATAPEPDDAAVAAFVATHPDRFAPPPRLRLTQIFLDPRRRAPAAIAALRRRLGAGPPAPGVAALGDPLPLPADPPPLSQRELANLFGDELAAAVAALPAGRWSPPLRSAYGLHLVYVHAREDGGAPPLDAVADAARQALRAERAARAVRATLTAWRSGTVPPSSRGVP